MDDIDMWLTYLERWWGESRNPLYVWEAVMRSTAARRPIPDWCLPCLAETAANITGLGWACAQRRISHERAAAMLPKATGLVRQGVNCFRQLASDARANRAAQDETHGQVVTETLMAERSVEREQARKILARGYRFLGLR
jgi:hypothetical protein